MKQPLSKVILACSLSVASISISAATITSTPTTTIIGAKAVLSPTKNNTASGIVTFTPVRDGIKIVADITGLTPGDHGFHIHEFGDCSTPDALSAGSHFNPAHEVHGAPNAAHRHVGDFGNLVADTAGKAHYEAIDSHISFTGKNNILGRSVIVHEKMDDLHSQPVGNAGGRVACGIIGAVNISQ